MNTKENITLLDDDIAFRYLFKEKDILSDFVNSFLEYVNKPNRFSYSESKFDNEMLANKRNKKIFYGDVIVTLDNEDILNIELYKNNFTLNNYNKSCSYMCRLYSNQLTRQDKDYQKLKKVISLNLIKGNFRRINDKVVNKYELNNVVNKKKIDEGSLEMYLARLDFEKTLKYNKNEKRFIKWIRFIGAKDMESMKEIGKDDEIMENSIRVITEWNNEKYFTNFDDYVEELKYESKQEGILEVAKKLLNANVNIKTISKTTGLSIDEIKEISNL